MTFGEHLEELRVCLFRSLMGLAVGFVVGLFFGSSVVKFIETPLEKALGEFYQNHADEEVTARVDELRKAGYPVPDDPQEVKKFVQTVIKDKNLILEEIYINPEELFGKLKAANPERFGDLPEKVADPEELFDASKLEPVFIWRPLDKDSRLRPKGLNAHEAFVIYIKASLLVGIIISCPWIFYQIWTFVAAGLYRNERKFVHVFLPMSIGLFLAGAAMAFFFVFKPVLDFLFGFNERLGIDPDLRISEWLSFVLMLPLGFGVSFQLPLAMLFLERIGIFDVEAYLSKWRVAILVIFILAMFLTPADPTSMLLMAVPLTILYGGGILLCKWFPRNRSPVDSVD